MLNESDNKKNGPDEAHLVKEHEDSITLRVPKLGGLIKGGNGKDWLRNIGGNLRSKFRSDRLKKVFNTSTLAFLILLLIPIFITISVRVQPIELDITEDWARNSIYTNIRNYATQLVDAQHPNLPSDSRNQAIEEEYQRIVSQEGDALEQKIKDDAAFYKTAFQYKENGNTYTYLGDLDSYYYLRQASNILEKGSVCDQVIEGKCIDDHMLAPIGYGVEKSLHPYAIVWTYKIMHTFDKSINLMYASFYLPTIVAVLVTILAFLIARRMAGNVAGFFAAMLIATSQMFLSRTMGSDTDIWNIFFPLLVFYIFIEVVEAKKLWEKLAYAAILGLAFGLYSFAWGAWWFSFDLLIISYGLYLAYYLAQMIATHTIDYRRILTDSKLKSELLTLGVIIASSAVFVGLISGFVSFMNAPIQPFIADTIDYAAHSNLWPNVYTTVAELNNSSLGEVVNTVGGKLIFFLFCMGIVLAMLRKELNEKTLASIGVSALIYFFLIQDTSLNLPVITYTFLLCLPAGIAIALNFKDLKVEVKYTILLAIWSAASIYAALKGVRFVLLLVPVAGIAFGVAVGKLHTIATSLVSKASGLKKIMVSVIIFAIIATMLIAPVRTAYATGKNFIPSISSTWAESLTGIGNQAAPDAILTSWWDFGHWFKYFSDRGVTFDGASQNIPQAHWVGKALQSDNEALSVGILRMLNCGGNTAYERLYTYMDNDSLSAIDTLYDIVVLDEASAYSVLMEIGISEDNSKEVVRNTHCEPPESYFITSDDMVGKAPVWAHFGAWDFGKAYAYNNFEGKSLSEFQNLMAKANYTPEEAKAIYEQLNGVTDQREINNWISPWPSYIGGAFNNCQLQQDSLICPFNTAISQTDQYMIVIEHAVFNTTDEAASHFRLSYIDRATGNKVSEAIVAPARFVIARDGNLDIVIPNLEPKMNLDVLIREDTNQAMLADPMLSASLFTRLYFLDGYGTTSFEKFSDMRNQVVGHRIIVWKVDWDVAE